jgi:hypothetical protein
LNEVVRREVESKRISTGGAGRDVLERAERVAASGGGWLKVMALGLYVLDF